MTEEDAEQKWCPFARSQAEHEFVSVNRKVGDGEADVDCFCLASRCMAWRWKGHDDGFCGMAGVTGAP